MAEAPQVFISYSHDSPAHKQWVAELASKLRHNGIDAILDQWGLSLGDDITLFMEEGLSKSDRVLVICTDNYVRKADAGEGGVGYERMIVTAELVANLGTNKFIPLIRDIKGSAKTPRFLATRFFIDFRDDKQFETEFETLLRELHKQPKLVKPPLGKNPFAVLPSGNEAPKSNATADRLEPIPATVETPSSVYKTAVALARQSDLLGWRQLVKQVRTPAFKSLVQWRKDNENRNLPSQDDVSKVIDEAVEIVAPLLVIALTGIESGREQLIDQKSVFDDLLNITGWERSGRAFLVYLPRTLGWVYHSLHGALCIATGQLQLAAQLAEMKARSYNGGSAPIWQQPDLSGWPDAFATSCTKAWQYIATAAQRWSWLSEIFGSESDYRTALAGYYMSLSVIELATFLTTERAEKLQPSQVRLDVPACFVMEVTEINRRAVGMVLRDRNSFRALWSRRGVRDEDIETAWPLWVQVVRAWVSRVYQFPLILEFPYGDLISPKSQAA